jgi:hypothetical protein
MSFLNQHILKLPDNLEEKIELEDKKIQLQRSLIRLHMKVKILKQLELNSKNLSHKNKKSKNT